MSNYFPNGLPKIVYWYDMDGEIMMVPGEGGVLLPVFENHRITVDIKKTCCVFCEDLEQRIPYDTTAPRIWDGGSEYCNSDEEALDYAQQIQADYARQGCYVPIHIRE